MNLPDLNLLLFTNSESFHFVTCQYLWLNKTKPVHKERKLTRNQSTTREKIIIVVTPQHREPGSNTKGRSPLATRSSAALKAEERGHKGDFPALGLALPAPKEPAKKVLASITSPGRSSPAPTPLRCLQRIIAPPAAPAPVNPLLADFSVFPAALGQSRLGARRCGGGSESAKTRRPQGLRQLPRCANYRPSGLGGEGQTTGGVWRDPPRNSAPLCGVSDRRGLPAPLPQPKPGRLPGNAAHTAAPKPATGRRAGDKAGPPRSPISSPAAAGGGGAGLTRRLSREEARSSAPRPVPAAAAGMGLCGRGWARCGPGPLWALALSRALPLRPCRTGGWAPPRPEGKAGYGLWAGGRALAPRGARGLRSSNPFTRGQEEEWRRRNRSALAYIAAAAVGMVGMSYAAVPLYRLYCQVRGSPAAPSRPLERAGAPPSPLFPSHRPRAWAGRRAPGTARSRSSAWSRCGSGSSG